MLDRLTGGAYRSTPHRVRNPAGTARLSYPFFFDPGFEVQVKRLPHTGPATEATDRWDRANPHAFEGTYGEYLLNKVGKVFPELHRRVL
jgi:polar amino acid transport system ATP-binding protein